ncbi:cytochrome c peroxidase [Maribacter confluentis]|uniref:Cytochrome c peroxidase n=1 Tax=Maribacter confluentis TaxID=1656093 RepID=A0ABT8RUX9_9FLAO|nr:cytochrome c peroxidase [Maribacter confluentis]MDO1514635.1 cytochrome c peroxidase [Maribacter confluentis]
MFKNLCYLLVFGVVLVSCKDVSITTTETLDKVPDFTKAHDYYYSNMVLAVNYMDSLMMVKVDDPLAKQYFKEVRTSFKKAEPYASYLKPEVGHRVNGPALPVLTEDTQKVLAPIGLQKIEESIYSGIDDEKTYERELELTKGLMVVLRNYIPKRTLTSQRFFISIHQQLMRIVSLGITGFDTPVSQLGIEETKTSLNSLFNVYSMSLAHIVKERSPELNEDFEKTVALAINFIGDNPNFETFDRYVFIRDYFNPITRNWLAIRKASSSWEPVDNFPFNFDAPTFFESNSFNPNFFISNTNKNPTQQQIDLGKQLFFDKNLSKNKDMACVTCHNPNKGWADNVVLNKDNEGKDLDRNTPTLINATFQQSQFWDGRSPDLIAQVSAVFTNEKEFASSVHQFSNEIMINDSYRLLFKEANGDISIKNIDMVKAISSYIATLNGFDSKFDKNIRAEVNSYTEEEKLGFNLFTGKALCATCHFIPLTNGTVPPFFAEHEKEIIGVPANANNKQLDEDVGFYAISKIDLQKGMFKTPTVRNVGVTAPYMHNGVYNTLEEVVNFYNLGGGIGLGFDLPHQTLPFDHLELTSNEENALVAFMNTLTDVPKITNY